MSEDNTNVEKRSLMKDTELHKEIDGELTLGVVEKQIVEISHIFHYWGKKYSEFGEFVKNAQLDFDIWMAIKKQEALNKKTMVMSSSEAARFKKDISGTASKELVITYFETEYREKLEAIYSAERKHEELEKALKAIDMKAFNLNSLASTLRKEWQTVK